MPSCKVAPDFSDFTEYADGEFINILLGVVVGRIYGNIMANQSNAITALERNRCGSVFVARQKNLPEMIWNGE